MRVLMISFFVLFSTAAALICYNCFGNIKFCDETCFGERCMITRSPDGIIRRDCINGSDPDLNFVGSRYSADGEFGFICNETDFCNKDFEQPKDDSWISIIVKIAFALRDELTSVNYQSGVLYHLEGSTADQDVLDTIDRNLTNLRNTVRGLEGFMDKLNNGKLKTGMSSSDALKQLPDSKSTIKNPPKASSLVTSGKLSTLEARKWLQKCADFLQSSIKTLSSLDESEVTGSPTRNNDMKTMKFYGKRR
ncbi:hypothetical protein FO519_003127 [Halicephalobus sp. NKZ332]|nr:hypothetical protein FO519_003127 [Halicephalobus sp. NKZ332]